MIAFKDFAPRVTDPGGVFAQKTFQSVEEAVESASRWCEHSHVVPLNVETVLLPNIYAKKHEGTTDAHVLTGAVVEWHQVVRVWYLTT